MYRFAFEVFGAAGIAFGFDLGLAFLLGTEIGLQTGAPQVVRLLRPDSEVWLAMWPVAKISMAWAAIRVVRRARVLSLRVVVILPPALMVYLLLLLTFLIIIW